MAFVPAVGALVGAKSFSGAAVSPKSAPLVAAVRMAGGEDMPTSGFSKVGEGSMWKENYFTGGFPGGESFYKAWTEDGMSKDVPDMPDAMQPKVAFKSKEQPRKGILARLDATEFFKGFSQSEEPAMTAEEDSADPVAPADVVDEIVESSDAKVPSPALYEKYFPADKLSIAPNIEIVYEKDFYKDRVYLSMREVIASVSDLYFPKWKKNKAPVIDICYNGSLATASVTVSMEDVKGLPTLPPPTKTGDAVTELVPGRGGGLKLQYSISGAGSVNI